MNSKQEQSFANTQASLRDVKELLDNISSFVIGTEPRKLLNKAKISLALASLDLEQQSKG